MPAMTHGLDYPVINLAIRGTNMAVMVGHVSLKEAESPNEFRWTGHLSFWNWKTGEDGERMNIPDKHKGLVFLREDVFVSRYPASTSPAASTWECRTWATLATVLISV